MKNLMENTGYSFCEKDYCDALEKKYSPYKSKHNLIKYFKDKKISKISLYPAGTMTQLLINEMGNTEDVKVEHIFDANVEGKIDSIEIESALKVKRANETDILIITAWYYYKNIYESIREKVTIPIVSILDLLSY